MKYTKGDITKTTNDFVIHGCNNKGVMGAGVAKAIRNKWPSAYTVYRNEWDKNGYLGLGTWTRTKYRPCVINLITQEKYGSDGKVYASLSAIQNGLRNFLNSLKDPSISTYSIPKIGCGLGGLQWKDVSRVLITIEKQYGIEFEVFEIV